MQAGTWQSRNSEVSDVVFLVRPWVVCGKRMFCAGAEVLVVCPLFVFHKIKYFLHIYVKSKRCVSDHPQNVHHCHT
jgi:hypothetical protein